MHSFIKEKNCCQGKRIIIPPEAETATQGAFIGEENVVKEAGWLSPIHKILH